MLVMKIVPEDLAMTTPGPPSEQTTGHGALKGRPHVLPFRLGLLRGSLSPLLIQFCSAICTEEDEASKQ
jgi:hypothetical protein